MRNVINIMCDYEDWTDITTWDQSSKQIIEKITFGVNADPVLLYNMQRGIVIVNYDVCSKPMGARGEV